MNLNFILFSSCQKKKKKIWMQDPSSKFPILHRVIGLMLIRHARSNFTKLRAFYSDVKKKKKLWKFSSTAYHTSALERRLR